MTLGAQLELALDSDPETLASAIVALSKRLKKLGVTGDIEYVSEYVSRVAALDHQVYRVLVLTATGRA